MTQTPRKRKTTIPLSKSHPHLMAEWDFERNREIGISPDKKTYGSDVKAWWICSKCREGWRSTIHNRTRTGNASGCPYCAGKMAADWNCLKNNDSLGICSEWHPDNELTPNQVTPHSNKRVKWQCRIGHIWQATISNRSKNHGCPFCIGWKSSAINNLRMNDPLGICKEWHPDNQLKPEDVTPCSGRKIKWICLKGHEWQATVKGRSEGRGCFQCYKESRKRKASEL